MDADSQLFSFDLISRRVMKIFKDGGVSNIVPFMSVYVPGMGLLSFLFT